LFSMLLIPRSVLLILRVCWLLRNSFRLLATLRHSFQQLEWSLVICHLFCLLDWQLSVAWISVAVILTSTLFYRPLRKFLP
jgi:hypothetical protein